MSQNRSAIVPLWGFHRSAMGKTAIPILARSILVGIGPMRSRSNRLNQPDLINIFVLNDGDLCQPSKSFCNRSDMGKRSKFRFFGRFSPNSWRIAVNPMSITTVTMRRTDGGLILKHRLLGWRVVWTFLLLGLRGAVRARFLLQLQVSPATNLIYFYRIIELLLLS